MHQSYVSVRRSYTRFLGFELSLLRLSRTIHAEATSVLYGENEFHFVFGITRRHEAYRDLTTYLPPYHGFQDNLMVVSEEYLKMIKKCAVEVRLPSFPWTRAGRTYLKYYERLAAFAAGFGGNDHSLQKMAVYFNRCFGDRYYAPLSCLRTCQNVLEPLAAIYGVGHSVTVGGVTPALEVRLSLAMMGQEIAYEPKEERYGERTIRVKRKKRLQRYKLGKYHESKNVWSQRVLGSCQLSSKETLLAYQCCEVCDEKSHSFSEQY